MQTRNTKKHIGQKNANPQHKTNANIMQNIILDTHPVCGPKILINVVDWLTTLRKYAHFRV